MLLTTIEIAWIAGILEGEGHFRSSQYGTPRIQVGM